MGELADIVNQAVDHQAARIAESDRRIIELETELQRALELLIDGLSGPGIVCQCGGCWDCRVRAYLDGKASKGGPDA